MAVGSFVYDVDLKIPNWKPSKKELMVFSAAMHKLAEQNLPFQRLDIDASLAREMFRDNQYKAKQISSIAAQSQSGGETPRRIRTESPMTLTCVKYLSPFFFQTTLPCTVSEITSISAEGQWLEIPGFSAGDAPSLQ